MQIQIDGGMDVRLPDDAVRLRRNSIPQHPSVALCLDASMPAVSAAEDIRRRPLKVALR